MLSGGGTATSQPYKINISGPSTSTLTYDDNGDTISDGTNTFDWDAEDRLIKITFSGSGNHTDFSYDPLSRPVKIVEFTSGSVTSTKQFIWCGSEMCEERDASGSLNDGKQFLSLGQINFSGGTGTNRLYQLSHKDIVGATNSSGIEVSAVSYSPWGEATVLSGSAQSFGYSGMYNWTRGSLNLNLTWFRQYNPSLARWLNRDPIGEDGGMNLFGYAQNNPISLADLLGLQSDATYQQGAYNVTVTRGGLYDYSDLRGKGTNHDQNFNPDYTIDAVKGFYRGNPDPNEFKVGQHGHLGRFLDPNTDSPVKFSDWIKLVKNSSGYKRAMRRGATKGRFWTCELGTNREALKNLGRELGLKEISAPIGEAGYDQKSKQAVMDINGRTVRSDIADPRGWVTVPSGL